MVLMVEDVNRTVLFRNMKGIDFVEVFLLIILQLLLFFSLHCHQLGLFILLKQVLLFCTLDKLHQFWSICEIRKQESFGFVSVSSATLSL
ncbi:hypothetical protein D3C76_1560060 [compost metagenome]